MKPPALLVLGVLFAPLSHGADKAPATPREWLAQEPRITVPRAVIPRDRIRAASASDAIGPCKQLAGSREFPGAGFVPAMCWNASIPGSAIGFEPRSTPEMRLHEERERDLRRFFR